MKHLIRLATEQWNYKLILVIVLTLTLNQTKAQQFNWAKRVGQISFDDSYTMALDNDNCVYIGGYYNGTVDFDPGPGVFNLTPTNQGGSEAYVLKLDSAGNFMMAFSFGGLADDEVRCINVDNDKNIYVSGTYKDTADFDPGPGVYNLNPTGNESVYIAKYDSTGALVWAKNIAATFHVYASGMDIDQAGSVYVTGNFIDTVDFDPGPNVFQLVTNSMYDAYILKLNNNGDFCFAYDIGQTTFDLGYDIKTDNFGHVYTLGTYRLTVDFNPGIDTFNITSKGYDDVFLLKMDTAGNFIWAKSYGGLSYDYGRSLDIDGAGNIVMTGSFSDIADFNPGPGVFNLTQSGIAGEDIFVSKLDSVGNFLWAKQFGGVGAGFGAAVATDIIGNVYSTGHFDGVTDFNPGPGVLNFTYSGLSGGDIYVVKLEASGNFAWAKQVGGPTYDYGYAIEPDALGNVYYTGFFEGTVDFNPSSGVFNMTSGGTHDIFVSKLGGALTTVEENTVNNQINLFPVPANDFIMIQTEEIIKRIELFDLNGHLLYALEEKEINTINGNIKLNTSALTSGIYFVKIYNNKATSIKKIVLNN